MKVRSGGKLRAMKTKEYAWMITEYTVTFATAVDVVSDVHARLWEQVRERARVKDLRPKVARVRNLRNMGPVYRSWGVPLSRWDNKIIDMPVEEIVGLGHLLRCGPYFWRLHQFAWRPTSKSVRAIAMKKFKETVTNRRPRKTLL